jgi:hypothetical protein
VTLLIFYFDSKRFFLTHQSAVPSNWLEFSGVMPLLASNFPRGESTLIFPDMNGSEYRIR